MDDERDPNHRWASRRTSAPLEPSANPFELRDALEELERVKNELSAVKRLLGAVIATVGSELQNAERILRLLDR